MRIKIVKVVGYFLILLLISSNQSNAMVQHIINVVTPEDKADSSESSEKEGSEVSAQKHKKRSRRSRSSCCDVQKKVDEIAETLDFLNGFVNLQALKTDCALKKIVNNLASCCDTLEEDFSQTWTILNEFQTDLMNCCTTIGSTSDVADTTLFADATAVNAQTNYDVIQWLKALYIKMIDCCNRG